MGATPGDPDTDGAGMGDLSGNTAGDPDRDTVSNRAQCLAGAEPGVENDAAGDGMPDVGEQTFFRMKPDVAVRNRNARKEQLGAELGADALEAELTTILTQFFDVTGPETPADLAVSVQENPGQPHLVSISFTPPGKILPSGQKVELSLPW